MLTRLLPGLAVAAVLLASLLVPARSLPNYSLVAGCGYGYGSPATVTGVAPRFGADAGGTTVTITGIGFCNATAVHFGATAATPFTVDSDTQITATSPAHADGTVDVTVTGPGGTSTTSTADHYTFLSPQAGTFKPKSPVRLADTRSSTPLGPGGTLTITVTGSHGVPANATSIVLNVTVTNTSAFSWLTVWPAGQSQPTASNLNWTRGLTVANLVEVQIGSGGQVSFNNAAGTVDVIVDLEGDYEPAGATTDGGFVPLPPSRIADSRNLTGGINTLGPGTTRDIQVAGFGGVPATGAEAVVFNATVTNTTASSWLTCWPTGQPKPTASNLNWSAGRTVPNRVTIMLGPGGVISCNNALGSTDLIIDVNGYYTDATGSGAAFVGVSPTRALDTRNGTGGFFTVGAGQTIAVVIATIGGVPAMGSSTPPVAVVLNVTSSGHAGPPGWFTVWPDATTKPTVSDVNFVAGQVVPNLVVVQIGTDGAVSINNANGTTDIIVDVTGYFVQT